MGRVKDVVNAHQRKRDSNPGQTKVVGERPAQADSRVAKAVLQGGGHGRVGARLVTHVKVAQHDDRPSNRRHLLQQISNFPLKLSFDKAARQVQPLRLEDPRWEEVNGEKVQLCARLIHNHM